METANPPQDDAPEISSAASLTEWQGNILTGALSNSKDTLVAIIEVAIQIAALRESQTQPWHSQDADDARRYRVLKAHWTGSWKDTKMFGLTADRMDSVLDELSQKM